MKNKIDKNLAVFVEKLKKGELVYLNGKIYRKLKTRNELKEVGRKNTKGYVQLISRYDGKEITAVAHRVIWAYFHGLNELPKNLQINHKNGIKDDNRIENLELVTPSENEKHAYRNGLKPLLKGERNPDSRLTTEQVIEIKKMLRHGLSTKEIASKFGVTATNIRHIKNGKTWNWLKLPS